MSSAEEIRERFVGSQDISREAFEELAMRLEILEHEREEKAAMARAKMEALRAMNVHQREKLHRLREKYHVLLEMYNESLEEPKEASDSSSSSDDEDDGNCSIM